MSPKAKKSSATDVVLAVILMFGLLSGFGVVWAVDYYQDTNGTTELLYTTDSNVDYPVITVPPDPLYYYTDIQNSYKLHPFAGGYYQYNKTAVYQGNNSWSMTVNGTTTSPSTSVLEYVLTLPNLNSWLIDYINVSVLVDTTDNDLLVAWAMMYTTNNVYDTIGEAPAERYQPIHTDLEATFQTTYPSGWYNKTSSLILGDSLNIHDLAQEKQGHFIFVLNDPNNDGFAQTTITINVEIYGEQLAEWSTVDTVTWGLLGASIVTFAIGIMATDQFDIGGYVKDLPTRRKRRGAK